MKKKIVRRSNLLSDIPVSSSSDPSALIAALLAARGEPYFSASDYQLKNLHPPKVMKGIDVAAEMLHSALEKNEKIMIVGDFDADGATSTAVLFRCLKAFGARSVHYLVPNRFEYGYGLTPEIVALAATQTPDLIVTVDNGISSIDGVTAAKAKGIKVIVTDHHLPGDSLPDADAIVNPNQPGCAFPSKNLAGVGVIYYVMLALRARLREAAWFELHNIAEPNMAQYLDLVALGTVADVVPLDFNNRILVAQGIQRIRGSACCVGILALLKIAGRQSEKISANDFGFAVGPRLNAAGRLDDMSVGIRCLLTDDWHEALSIAAELNDLNQERRAIESSMQQDALQLLSSIETESAAMDANGICLYQDDWHQGVVGILASRIKDRTHRPTIAFARTGDTEIKGSGRSVQGVHLRDVLDEVATKHPHLLSKFGGHAMAAGLSINLADLQAFTAAFNSIVGRYLSDEMRQPIIVTDGELRPMQLSISFAEAIRDAGPWGQMFPEPTFDGVFRLVDQRLVGAKHLKMMLGACDSKEVLIDAIAFNVDLAVWPNTNAQKVRVAYKLDVNEFRGRVSPQMIVDFIAPYQA